MLAKRLPMNKTLKLIQNGQKKTSLSVLRSHQMGNEHFTKISKISQCKISLPKSVLFRSGC